MERKNQHAGGQGNGFLLGVVVGIAIALLFTTKRGREIFKELLEQAAVKVTELEKLLKEQQAKEKVEEATDFVAKTPVPAAVVAEAKKAEVKKPATPVQPVAVPKPAPPAPKPAPAPVVTLKEVKTAVTEAISPHVVQSIPVVQKVEQKVEEIKAAVKEEVKETVKEAIEESKKSSTGKRWFRGLRKRS